MKVMILFVVVLAVSQVHAAYVWPQPQRFTDDGSIEVFLDSYRFNGSQYRFPAEEGKVFEASVISGDGLIVAGSILMTGDTFDFIAATDIMGCIWKQTQPPTSSTPPIYSYERLPLLDGFQNSQVINMSRNGQYIIGNNYWLDGCFGPTPEQASYWNADGDVYSLGSLNSGWYHNKPLSVSNNGLIVGFEYSEELDYQFAFIWDKKHGMRDLQEVLENDYGYDFNGWILASAHDITSDGTVITGYGINPENEWTYWIAEIPEPSTVILLGLGGLFLRKKRKTDDR